MIMYDKIKKWYTQGLWNEAMVRAALEKGIITAEDADSILKEENA